MNKSLVITALSVFALIALFLSCSEEKDDYATPRFGKMSTDPSPAIAGEYVTITLHHEEQGNGIAGTNYAWKVAEVTKDPETGLYKDTTINVHTNYDGYGKQDPVLKFLLPADCPSGRHKVTMNATFQGYIGNHLYDKASASDYITVK